MSPADQEDLSTTAYLMLGMVQAGANTGYAIKKRVERLAGLLLSVSFGQIYPELKGLESAGYLESRETKVNGRLRREYEVSPAGRSELDRWLAAPRSPEELNRTDAIVRVFVADWDEPVAAEKVLELRELAATRKAVLEMLTPPKERGRRLQTLGVDLLGTVVEWCDETIQQMESDRDSN